MTAAGQMCLAYGITTAERFEQFHDENPIVYVTLVRLAREWVKATGRHKIGMAALRERARWEIVMATNDPDFKINNNYTPFYARLIMARCEDLADMFNLRASEAVHMDHHLPAGSTNRMTATVINVHRHGAKPARAVQITDQLTYADIDDVLYGFGFEYFGENYGTQRLVAIDDDSIEDYGDAAGVMRQANAVLALFDRDAGEWVALEAGDWVVEPQDDRGDGFIKMSDASFADEYRQTANTIDAAHIARQAEFSGRTFGPGTRTAGVLDHIAKELDEIRKAPMDLSEWADVIILALDGAWRTGAAPQDIIDAIVAKQEKNESRAWPDWRGQDPDKAIEHHRGGGA